MEIIKSIILGIVQGITEFLPISSSGHLIIFRDMLGMQVDYGLSFDAVLQLATTFAVFVYFRKDIVGYIKTFFKIIGRKSVEKKEKTLLFAIILGTIPAVLAGFFLEDFMDTAFRSSFLVAIALIVGGIIMLIAEKVAKKDKALTIKNGIGVGIFQVLALVPGFSRAGMSISGGLFLGLNREEATRFSFLLAFPILAGSGLKKLLDLGSSGLLDSVGTSLIFGSISAFIVGLFAIHFLISHLKKHTMTAFVVYRFVVAILILIFI